MFWRYLPWSLALFNNDANVETKNAPVFLLVLRVIENFFYKACFVPGLFHLPHLDPLLLALDLLKSKKLCRPNIGMYVGCLSRGKGLQFWRIVLRLNFGGAYLEKKSLMALSQNVL